MLRIRIADKGPGIANLQSILDGQYRSQSGMGLGLIGARRLMDHFRIDTGPGKGTTVELDQHLPRSNAPIASRKAVRDRRRTETRRHAPIPRPRCANRIAS